jgi:DNA-binding transcriptional regulator YiaG
VTTESMWQWRSRFELTQEQAGAALGFSRRQIQVWEAGEDPVPDHVTLAMRYLAEHPEELAARTPAAKKMGRPPATPNPD